MAAKRKAKCLTKGCQNPVRARGLCTQCYYSARDSFVRTKNKAKKKTWEQLEAEGLALPLSHEPTAFTKQMRSNKAKSKAS